MSSSRKDLFLNAQMGDHKLTEILAVGGMARVYQAMNENLERPAAVKVLDMAQDWVDETIIQRFEREAKAVAALHHENIITIYQYGLFRDETLGIEAYYLAMQLVQGKDLRQVIREFRGRGDLIPIDRVLYIMRQVASALDYAHQHGIIHRDIKPSNILLDRTDRAVLTDFGLVLRNTDKTQGTAFGTPRYIAPEQAVASQQAVPQSDIYSLAVIMYEILTGDTPFDGESPMEIALAHVSDEPDTPTSRNPNLPPAIDTVMQRALHKDPDERYDSAAQFVEAVEQVFAGTYQPEDETSGAVPILSPNATYSLNPGERPVDSSRSEAGGNSMTIIAGGIAAALVVIGGLAFALFGLNPGSDDSHAEVMLYYNGENFVIHNAGDYTLEQTNRLDFVRGRPNDGADDYNGTRISEDRLLPGQCWRIELLNGNRLTPPQCEGTVDFEGLTDVSRFHWRQEPVETLNFEVHWDGSMITRCETVRRGERKDCSFRYPLPPPEDNTE